MSISTDQIKYEVQQILQKTNTGKGHRVIVSSIGGIDKTLVRIDVGLQFYISNEEKNVHLALKSEMIKEARIVSEHMKALANEIVEIKG